MRNVRQRVTIVTFQRNIFGAMSERSDADLEEVNRDLKKFMGDFEALVFASFLINGYSPKIDVGR